MTRAEIVELVSKKTGKSKSAVALILKSFFNEMFQAVEGGERVTLHGDGMFALQFIERATFGKEKKVWRKVKFTPARQRSSHGKVRRRD